MDCFKLFFQKFIELQSKKAIQENINPELITNLFNFSTYKKNTPYALTSHFIIEALESIESNLYFKKYYGFDKEQISKFKNRFISALLKKKDVYGESFTK